MKVTAIHTLQKWLDGPAPRLVALIACVALLVCGAVLAFQDRTGVAVAIFIAALLLLCFLFLPYIKSVKGPLGFEIKTRKLPSQGQFATSEDQPEIETVPLGPEAIESEAKQVRGRTRARFELVPNLVSISKGQNLEVSCMISGLEEGDDPTLGGFTLVVLWNRNELDFADISFSDELGNENQSSRNTVYLSAGVFNPADPDFAAIVFSNYSNLSREELTGMQSAAPVIATFTFTSLTDGPIRLNAGFPYAANSLIDAERRPAFRAGVSALFLNQPET